MDSHHPKTEIQTDQKKTKKINTPPPAYLLACIKRIACMVVVKDVCSPGREAIVVRPVSVTFYFLAVCELSQSSYV